MLVMRLETYVEVERLRHPTEHVIVEAITIAAKAAGPET